MIGQHHELVKLERNALQQVAKGHTKDDGRYGATGEQGPVPVAAPFGISTQGAVLETDRTQEQRHQGQDHGDVEAGEGRGIHHRPSGEQGTTSSDQPNLVTFPVRPHGVEHHAALDIFLADEREQCAYPHVEAVSDGKTDQQYADQSPPDDTQSFVIKHGRSPYALICSK